MRAHLAGLVVAALLLVVAVLGPRVRRDFIDDVITWDAPASAPVTLPGGSVGEGLPPAARVRVVLIDGLGSRTAHMLRTWSALCTRGVRLTVDVGFPTVSLPVEVSLWTGLTQQQTGVVFRSDRPLVPPLDRRGLPARVPDSVAIAEHHGYIVRSLGFAQAAPAAGDRVDRDRDPAGWASQWQARAEEAVASAARLVFVHVLRVDTLGHRRGGASMPYAIAAGEADAILARLVARDPDARWFLLSDHGHLDGGGHGGEDPEVRFVEGCIVGPGVSAAGGGPVHLVDVSRALADSLALPLDARSPGRPLSVALAHPLGETTSIPPVDGVRAGIALVLVVLALVASAWGTRRWWLAPWWFVLACALLVIVRGAPTMSMPMIYGRESLADLFDLDRRLMMRCWLPALGVLFGTVAAGASRVGLTRTLVAQLALPVAMLAGALTACHGWSSIAGAEVAPVVPHYTALVSPLMLMVSQGAGAAGLAVLARTALAVSGRRRPSESSRSST